MTGLPDMWGATEAELQAQPRHGRHTAAGAKTPSRRYSHRVSGTDPGRSRGSIAPYRTEPTGSPDSPLPSAGLADRSTNAGPWPHSRPHTRR